MLAPEERHRVEPLARAHHVERGGLALALRHHPMLDADVLAGMRIGPARDIARRVDPGDARLEKSVHQHAAVEREAGLLGQPQPRPHPDADHDEVGVERAAALERGARSVDRHHVSSR